MPNTIDRRDAMLRIASATLATGLGVGWPVAAASSRYGIIGQSAPVIEATHWIDADGHATTFSMQELQGRWVYLKCFQSWCPGCHKYGFPTLKKVSDALAGEEGFRALALQTVFEGFGINTRAKVRDIQTRYGLRMTMGHDPGDADGDHRPVTMQRYRTGGTPWVVIISPDGQVVFNDYHIDADKIIGFLEERLG